MGKNTMNYFAKLALGMNIVSQALMAAEDGKVSSTEILAFFRSTLAGFGVSGVDVKGVTLVEEEDGSISINIPKKLVDKLNITVA